MDRHAQSDSKGQVIYITKIYFNTKLVFRMWLGICKYNYLIQSYGCSQTPGYAKK